MWAVISYGANLVLLLLFGAAIWYVIYVKRRSRVYTRERYCFAALAAIVSLVALVIDSLARHSPWASFAGIVAHIMDRPLPPAEASLGLAESALVAALAGFAVYVIGQTVHQWGGLISVKEKESRSLYDHHVWILDAMEEARRIVTRQGPLPIYHPIDYSRSFPSLDAPKKDSLAWHENARQLITLIWRTHVFDGENWHPKPSIWIGRNTKTFDVVALLCTREQPPYAELEQFVEYVLNLNLLIPGHLEFFVAIQGNTHVETIAVRGYSVALLSEHFLLDKLVDFTDYFIEIERRVTKDLLPDSDRTISDIYVHPFGSHSRDTDPFSLNQVSDPIGVQSYLHTWAAETSPRQIALLGEYGQGKSTIALKFAHDLIEQGGPRVPVLIELRGKSPSTLQPLELLGAWSAAYRIDAQALLKLVAAGRVLLIFEGFDEMSEVGDAESRFNHFRALWKFCYPSAKILITGRPNLFLDDDELKAALGISAPTGAGPYCEALYINFFTSPEISTALDKLGLDTAARDEMLTLAANDQQFYDIVRRPSLLYIVALLRKRILAESSKIDSARIMQLFIEHSHNRQAAKQEEDRQFMILSIREREFFLDGVAAYMIAQKSSNQIMPEQFHHAITSLYAESPPNLYRTQRATMGGPSKPLTERVKGRLRPIEDIETDVRTYGILVRDYSRPGALKFPHKSFFEFLFARYVAKRLVGLDKEESGAILAATGVSIARVADMPECLKFLGEILARHGAIPRELRATNMALLSQEQMAQKLFNLIVFGPRVPIPSTSRISNFITRFFIVEGVGYGVGTLVLLFGSVNLGFLAMFGEIFNLSLGSIAIWFFSAILMMLGAAKVASMSLRGRIRLWGSIIKSMGIALWQIKKVYGRHAGGYVESEYGFGR